MKAGLIDLGRFGQPKDSKANHYVLPYEKAACQMLMILTPGVGHWAWLYGPLAKGARTSQLLDRGSNYGLPDIQA